MKNKTLFRGFDSVQKNELKSVMKVAKQCNYEAKHTKQVTKFALEIFDDLSSLHQMGPQERYYLLCAALLHDIGVHTEGAHAHHKTALKIILNTPLLTFNQKDRLIIGSIARYHRRALPSLKHDHYKALSKDEREMVSRLAGILRVADGLEYSHELRIQNTQTTFNKNKIVIHCMVRKEPIKNEIKNATKKSDLLSLAFQRNIVFKIQKGEEFIGWS
jgi:exopolyphosphatase/guanosine-5'-triphosphate,3'-diphosphate pyrophosphatase